MPGTIELLQYFQAQKVPMAVASSSDRAVIEEKLRQSGIISYFDVLIGGDEVTHGKPDPEIFLKAAAALQVPIEDCYVFEDSFNGVRAGAASGALTVMIPDQVPPTEEISSLCTLQDSLLKAKEAIQAGTLN
jgi:HAD superfamily hydrolase (TIGR01509 family)